MATAAINSENLYILKQCKVSQINLAQGSLTSIDIAHQKLGHISKEAIVNMKNSGKVSGLDYVSPSDPL